jgi:glutamate carboxypeptidase
MCWKPAQGLAYKTARKGTGTGASMSREWRPTPAWTFEKGASAILELARVVETVSGWTDLKRGLTVSVGVAGGGTRS